MSKRRDYLVALRTAARALPRRYLVKRGVLNWATHDFTAHPLAMSILAEGVQLFERPGTEGEAGSIPMQVRLEAFTATADPRGDDPDDPGIDDDVLDFILEDVRCAIRGAGESACAEIDARDSRAVESHDATFRVQGVIAQISVML